MNVIAAIEVELEVTPLGTRSRLHEPVCGVPMLRRTAERIAQARHVSGVHVLCPEAQVSACRDLLHGTTAVVHPHTAGPPPWRGLVRASRKWALDGLRGGIGGTTAFDEYTDARLLAALIQETPCDAVLSIPPAAPFIDPALADRMVEHLQAVRDEARIVFMQTPPGVTGVLLESTLIAELHRSGTPIAWLFSYKPDAPQKDLALLSCCAEAPVELRHAAGRLIGDTDRAITAIHDLANELAEPDAASIGRWLQSRNFRAGSLPREIEVELTTDDPLPSSLLRPRGQRVPVRGPLSVELASRVAESVIVDDTGLVVLGGFGDPLRHTQFRDVLAACRPTESTGGVHGLAVRTAGLDLTEAVAEQLVEYGVDVVEFMLDAWTAETYGRVHGIGGDTTAGGSVSQAASGATGGLSAGANSCESFAVRPRRSRSGAQDHTPNSDAHAARSALTEGGLARVLAAIDCLTRTKERMRSPRPIVLPSFCKARPNVHEMDEFFDGWSRRVGAAMIHSATHRAGQQGNLGVISMAPPRRTPCSRLWNRCIVLADGSVTTCDQDFAGRMIVGHIGKQSLSEIWNGAGMNAIRAAHQQGDLGTTALCVSCDEWHRP